MLYLDVGPVIGALRSAPQEFEVWNGSLRHIRSRHSFVFDEHEHVRINAECECALLAVRPDQQQEFAARFRAWQADYWRPLEINRKFAAHFGARPLLLRVMIALTAHLHRWLLGCGGRNRMVAATASQPQ